MRWYQSLSIAFDPTHATWSDPELWIASGDYPTLAAALDQCGQCFWEPVALEVVDNAYGSFVEAQELREALELLHLPVSSVQSPRDQYFALPEEERPVVVTLVVETLLSTEVRAAADRRAVAL